jgi:hypothetical protein
VIETNQRSRKKAIPSLEADGILFEKNRWMIGHAVEFYKNLLGKETRNNRRWLMGEGWKDFWGRKPDGGIWVHWRGDLASYQGVLFWRGPGLDGFSFLFYKKFWSIIMRDLMALVKKFEKGGINIARLNYAMIILIPKEKEARSLK